MPHSLPLALRFARGAAQVRCAQHTLGPVCIEAMTLALQRVTFPTDLTHGAQGFCRHPSRLLHLRLSLPLAAAQAFVDALDAHRFGVGDLRVLFDAQKVRLCGVVLPAAHTEPTPFAIDWAVRWLPGGNLLWVATDVRQYGHSAWSQAQLLGALHRLFAQKAGATIKALDAWRWQVFVPRAFAHIALPHCGWRPCATSPLHGVAWSVDEQGARLEVAADEALAATPSPSPEPLPAALLPIAKRLSARQLPEACELVVQLLGEMAANKLCAATAQLAGRWLLGEASVDGDGPAARCLQTLPAPLAQLALGQPTGSGGDLSTTLDGLALPLAFSAAQLAAVPWALREAGSPEAVAAALVALAQRDAVAEPALAFWGAAALLADVSPDKAQQALVQAQALWPACAGLHALGHRIASQKNDAAAAVHHAQKWLRSVGDKPLSLATEQALWVVGQAAGARGEAALLAECAQQAQTLPTSPSWAQAWQAWAFGLQQQNGQARALAEALTRQAGAQSGVQAAQTWFAAAVAYGQGAGDEAAAHKALRRALGEHPAHVLALRALAERLEAQHESKAAAECAQAIAEAIESLPRGDVAHLCAHERLQLHLRLVEQAVAQTGPGHWREGEDGERAAGHLKQALRLAPGREALRARLETLLDAMGAWALLAELRLRHAQLLVARGEHAQARAAQRQAAALLAERGAQPSQARSLLLALLRDDPSDTDSLQLALPLLSSDEAQRVLQRAIASQPSALCRGRLLMMAAERCAQDAECSVADKERAYRQVLMVLPQHWAAATGLVDALEQAGRRGDAAHDARLALAYEDLAYAAPAAADKARALLHAARAHVLCGARVAAQKAVDGALASRHDDAHAWRLRLQLCEQDNVPWPVRQRLLTQALRAVGEASGAHPLWLMQADGCASAGDQKGEIEALEHVVQQGGATRPLCERLLQALAHSGQRARQVAWLLRLAERGWPLDGGACAWQAAQLCLPDDVPLAKKALLLAVHAGGECLWQACCALRALAEKNDWPTERIAALQGQLQAVQQGHIEHVDVGALEIELLWAQADGHAYAEADATSTALLGHDPHHPAAHGYLAERLLRHERWDDALDHCMAALCGPRTAVWHGPRREAMVVLACELAALMRPALLPRLQAAAADPVPDPSPLAFLKRLQRQGESAREEALLRRLLAQSADHLPMAALRLRLAERLATRPSDRDQAETLLRAHLQQAPRDVFARQLLLQIVQAQSRWRDAAELHFALSQLLGERDEALAHVLQSAEALLRCETEPQMATDIVLAFAQRQDVPKSFAPLWHGMRRLGMHQALAQFLQQSLERSPSSDDGRLGELVSLLCNECNDTERAVQWCQRFVAHLPEHDAPWQLLVDVLTQHGEAAGSASIEQAASVFAAWANARSGEARSHVLAALSAHLEHAGHRQKALVALREALSASEQAAPDLLGRLQSFIDGMLAHGAFAEAAAAISERRRYQPDAAARDADARFLAELYEQRLDDAAGAWGALLSLQTPTAAEREAMVRLACRIHAWEPLGEQRELLLALPVKARAALARQAAEADAWAFVQKATALWLSPSVFTPHGAQTFDALAQALRKPPVFDAVFGAWLWSCVPVLAAVGASQAHPSALQAAALLCTEPPPDAWAEPAAQARAIVASARAEAMRPEVAQAVLARAPFGTPAQARHAFAWAQAVHLTEWAERAAQGIDARDCLPAEQAAVLAVQAQAALAQGDGHRAEQLVQQLAAVQPDAAEPLLDAALRAQGRHEEVVARLQARVQALPPNAEREAIDAAQWGLAEALAFAQRDDEAHALLLSVPAQARVGRWAPLLWQVARRRGDAKHALLAAEHAAGLAEENMAHALWLRRAAHLLWEIPSQREAAKTRLRQAHALEPQSAQKVLDGLEGLAQKEATQRLQQALCVLPRAEQPQVWQCLAELGPARHAREAISEGLACIEEGLSPSAATPPGSAIAERWCEAALALQQSAQRLGQPLLAAQASELCARASDAQSDEQVATRWLDAAQQLLSAAEWARAGHALAQAHKRWPASPAARAALGPRAFAVAEQCAQRQSDANALAALYAQAPQIDGLTSERATALLRRAAWLAASMPLSLAPAPLWQALRQRDPLDGEAARQHWRLCLHVPPAELGEALCEGVLADMQTHLGALPYGPTRARRTEQAAALWPPERAAAAIALLGRAFNEAAEQAAPGLSEADPARWAFLQAIGEALLPRLDAHGPSRDAFVVASRLAYLAPAAQREARLWQAGERALALGEPAEAHALFRPVAMADPLGEAWSRCVQFAEQRGQASEAMALYTERARRAAPAEAARCLTQAALWAEKDGASAREPLRLLLAAHALCPTAALWRLIIERALSMPQHVLAAARVFDPGLLPPSEALADGLRLAEASLALPELRRADALALAKSLQGPLAEHEAARAAALALVERSGDPLALAHALLSVKPADPALACVQAMRAARLAQTLTQPALAQKACLIALTDAAAPPSWGLTSWRLRDGDAAFEHALGERLRPLLSVWQRFAGTPPPPAQAPADWRDEQIAIWQLQSERAQARGDDAAAAGALEALLAWQQSAPVAEWAPTALGLAAALAKQGAVAEAAVHWRTVAACAQASAAARIEACVALSRHDLDADGPALLEQAAALSAEAPEQAPSIALALLAVGRTQQAERLCACSSEDAPPARLLAYVACLAAPADGQAPGEEKAPSPRAVQLAQTLHEMALAHPILTWVLAREAEAHGQRAQAMALYEKTTQTEQNDAAAWALEVPRFVLLSAWQRWARLCWHEGQVDDAFEVVRQAAQRVAVPEEAAALHALGCDWAERAERWEEAARFAAALAVCAKQPSEQVHAALRAAQIERVHLGDWQRAARSLWQAVRLDEGAGPEREAACEPLRQQAWQALWDLLDAVEPYLEREGPWRERRLQAAEQVLLHTPLGELSSERGLRMASVFAQDDPARALSLLRLADEQAGVPAHLHPLWQDVAFRAGDWATFIRLAEQAEKAAQKAAMSKQEPSRRTLWRRVRLAEAHARQSRNAQAARPHLLRALEGLRPPTDAEDVAVIKRAADLCASLGELREEAVWLYAEVLRHTPLDTEALRMAARVAGQLGDTERAWGLYACLLWLLPNDAEAGRFVVACRSQWGEPPSAGARGRPLVKHVQQALEEVAEAASLDAEARPERAYDVAQLLRSDIEVVLGEMVSAPFHEPRAHSLARVPAAYTLFRFAQSPAYFALKQRLRPRPNSSAS